jgi:signal transduction histidine kinase
MSEELEQFVYSVSHDVKAPLRAIANLTSWIEEELGANGSPTLSENISLLKGRVLRTQKMLEGITDFSRAATIYETGLPFKPQEVIRNVAETLDLPGGFRVELEGDMPEITAGKNKLKQIFTHLIANAAQHHDKETGTVRISCLDLEDSLQFVVTDDGPGIPAEHHQTVFELFQTLRPKDETDTVGAGLAIVRKIVDSMGCKIWIDDTVQSGTSIHFTWKK